MIKTGKRILKSAREALAYARGEADTGFVAHVPDGIDVKSVRERTGLSQPKFAQRIGVPVGTLRNWEQRRREPEGPARILLALLEKRPNIVEELLSEAAP